MKRRFIQQREPPYDLIEIFDDPEPRRQDGLMYNDRIYDGLRATDGTDISSRTKHRAYMAKNGLTTMDDFKEYWQKEAERRGKYYTNGEGGAVSKYDVARAIHELESKSRRKR